MTCTMNTAALRCCIKNSTAKTNKYTPWAIKRCQIPTKFCPYLHRILTDFKNSFTSALCGNFAITKLSNISPRLNCVAALHVCFCLQTPGMFLKLNTGKKISLKFFHRTSFCTCTSSDCMIFEIYTPQGNVTTQLRCGGIFNNHVIANFPQSVPVNFFLNRSIFGEDMDER